MCGMIRLLHLEACLGGNNPRAGVMLECLILMGSLFVSDGQMMIAASSMSRVERAGDLLLVGAGAREDVLDVSNYPADVAVHTILADCAAQAGAVDLAAVAEEAAVIR